MSNVPLAIMSGILGAIVGLLLRAMRLNRLRTWWSCWRDGVKQRDIVAAMEAAAVASDLKLAWDLSQRYHLRRCANCARYDAAVVGALQWARARTDVTHLAEHGLLRLHPNDTQFYERVGVCTKCWLLNVEKVPVGWIHAVVR